MPTTCISNGQIPQEQFVIKFLQIPSSKKQHGSISQQSRWKFARKWQSNWFSTRSMVTKQSLTYRKLIGRPIVIVHASERTGNCPKCTAAIDALKIAPAHMDLGSRLFRDPAICSESRHQSRPRTRRMTACWDLYGNVILTTNKVAKKRGRV